MTKVRRPPSEQPAAVERGFPSPAVARGLQPSRRLPTTSLLHDRQHAFDDRFDGEPGGLDEDGASPAIASGDTARVESLLSALRQRARSPPQRARGLQSRWRAHRDRSRGRVAGDPNAGHGRQRCSGGAAAGGPPRGGGPAARNGSRRGNRDGGPRHRHGGVSGCRREDLTWTPLPRSAPAAAPPILPSSNAATGLAEVATALAERDRSDSTRAVSPLVHGR